MLANGDGYKMSEDDAAWAVGLEIAGASALALLTLPWAAWLAAKDAASWIQAIGGVLAIIAGFIGLAIQRAHAERDEHAAKVRAVYACSTVVRRTLEQVGDRLLVASEPHSKRRHGMALREYRTTEMVSALRELKLIDAQLDVLSPLAALRADLYAVNARITDIYKSEEQKSDPEEKIALEARRSNRIKSSLVVYGSALGSYANLQSCLRKFYGLELENPTTPEDLIRLIRDTRPADHQSGGWPANLIENQPTRPSSPSPTPEKPRS